MQYLLIASLVCALFPFTGSNANLQQQQQSISVSTNEGRAMKVLRHLFNAQATYQSTAGNGEYGDLLQLHATSLIDKDLEDGVKDGYRFIITIKKSSLSSSPSFDLVARPIEYGKSGRRSFYLTGSGVLLTSEAKDAPLSEMRPFASGTGETKPNAVASNDSSGVEPPEEEASASDIAANESAAIATLRAIHSAEKTLKERAGAYGTLSQLETQQLLDGTRAAAGHNGYLFEVKISASASGAAATFNVTATPQTYGVSGRRSFYTDHTGVLRAADKEGGPADGTDPAIEK